MDFDTRVSNTKEKIHNLSELIQIGPALFINDRRIELPFYLAFVTANSYTDPIPGQMKCFRP